MKVYSEITKDFYDSVKECEKAEQEVKEAEKKAREEKDKLIAERKSRADAVEASRKKMIEAQKEYEHVLNDFLRDYKTYHYSTCTLDDIPRVFSFLDNPFFKLDI